VLIAGNNVFIYFKQYSGYKAVCPMYPAEKLVESGGTSVTLLVMEMAHFNSVE
jgi:hypothetical protein